MRHALVHYLTGVFQQPVDLGTVRQLGAPNGAAADPKEFGYGAPVEIERTVGGSPRRLVLARTRVAQGFWSRLSRGSR